MNLEETHASTCKLCTEMACPSGIWTQDLLSVREQLPHHQADLTKRLFALLLQELIKL